MAKDRKLTLKERLTGVKKVEPKPKPKLFSLKNVKAKDVAKVAIQGLETAKGKSIGALPSPDAPQEGSKMYTGLDTGELTKSEIALKKRLDAIV